MKRRFIPLAAASAFALSGCVQATDDEIAGALVGGVLGAITATALGADDSWLVVGTLAGAAAGVLVARNRETGDCAYSNGDGTYYRAACP